MDYQPETVMERADEVASVSAAEQVELKDTPHGQALKAAAEKNLSRLQRSKVNAAAASRYKTSHYDIPVALSDGSALLFNSRTRSLILLSETEAKTYRDVAAEGSFPPARIQDKILLQSLADGGHILGANIDELSLVRLVYDATRGNVSALNLTIAPTMACNFACGYCYQGLNKPTKKMAPDVQDAIITFVKAKKNIKSVSICWYGGEPLMGKESIYKLSDSLIAYCDKNNISYSASMVSNAYFLTADVAAQLYSRRVKSVQVTIDGDKHTHDQMRPLTSGHGTFDRIMENVAAVLDETPLAINARVNVGLRNIDKVHEMLDALVKNKFARRGNFSVYFAPIEASTPESGSAFDEKMGRAEFNKAVLALEERARSLGLAATITPPAGFLGMCVAASAGGYVITGSGDVHKCWETAHDSTKRTGSIFAPDELHDSVNASLWQQWSPFDNPTCSSCKILPMCGGFCGQRFIYGGPDQTALPCPSWKWNTAEYIFSRAKDLGVVTADKWLPKEATILAEQSGARHSAESLLDAQDRLLEKVSTLRKRKIDREMLYAGEAALEAQDAVAGGTS